MKIKELEKEIKGQISVLDKDELEEVLKFVNQMIIKERIMKNES